MNRERAKELLPIIQAFGDGKAIQWKNNMGDWVSYDPKTGASVDFDADVGDKWRIKPEPKEFWLRLNSASIFTPSYKGQKPNFSEQYIHVREVIDND